MCKEHRGYHVLIVHGPPGIGKTHLIEKLVAEQEANKSKDNTDLEIKRITVAVSPVNFYKFLWSNNDKCVVLDDVTTLLKDAKDGAALLKAATDTYKVRELNWNKSNKDCIAVSQYIKDNNYTNDDVRMCMRSYINNICADMRDKSKVVTYKEKLASGVIFPDKFKFTGSLIILTNKQLSEFDRVTEGAVSNRGAHMELTITKEVSIDIINNMAKDTNKFGDINVDEEIKNKVLKYVNSDEFKRYLTINNKTLSIRNFIKMLSEVQDGRELDYLLLDAITEESSYV